VDVKVIDSMVGFLDDVGANYGGVVSSKSFSVGARNRAQGAKIDLRVIPFISAETVIDDLFPASTFPIQETRCTYHFFEKPKVTFKQSAVGFVLKRACFWAWHPA
jgi:hypothetical protein